MDHCRKPSNQFARAFPNNVENLQIQLQVFIFNLRGLKQFQKIKTVINFNTNNHFHMTPITCKDYKGE